MPSAESHALDNNRIYQGEESAGALVNWLNSTKNAEARGRMIEIVNAFFGIIEVADRIRSSTTPDDKGRVRVLRSADPIRLEAHGRLNALLRHYVLTPCVLIAQDWTPYQDMPHTVTWRTAGGEFERSVRALAKMSGSSAKSEQRRKKLREFVSEQAAEIEALLTALNLMNSGLIAKVAQCNSAGCDKIFFQKFSHQRFCSEKCRVSHSRDSDEARAKRAAYARKLYHLHKSGKVK